MVNFGKVVLVAGCVVIPALAHPGQYHDPEEVRREIAERDVYAAHIQRGLQACSGHPNYMALKERAQTRRFNKAKALRSKRGLDASAPYVTRRDLAALEQFETVNHNMTSTGYTTSTAESTIFSSNSTSSCILTPEVVVGPYYVTGEYVRTDVVDGQTGVPVHLEYQYVDVSTCDTAPDLYLETWQANATGVYSGIQANGNGNDEDATNLNTTFLRGIAKSDSDGVAFFDTVFAGHYTGRATHIHIMTHPNGTIYDNGTFQSSSVVHIGQIFFDESLRAAVELTSPYNENTQTPTTNDEDMWAPAQADNNYDPFPDFAYLGSDITDGLLMWITIGVDMSASYESLASAAGALTAEGGTSDSGSAGMGGGSGAPGGNGTAPTGGMPSGTMGGAPAAASTVAAVSTSSTTSSAATSHSSASSGPASSLSSSLVASAVASTSSSAVAAGRSSAKASSSSVATSSSSVAASASSAKTSAISTSVAAVASAEKTSSTSVAAVASVEKTSSTSVAAVASAEKTSTAVIHSSTAVTTAASSTKDSGHKSKTSKFETSTKRGQASSCHSSWHAEHNRWIETCTASATLQRQRQW